MITEERLKLYLDDIYIYNFYLGDFEIRFKYNSPLRDDPKPSFQIKVSEKGNLYWKDYGLDKQKGYDAVAFVMHLYDLERKEAVQRIWDDIVKSGNPLPTIKLKVDTSSIPMKHYYGELRDWELEYWKSRGITKDLLDYYNVKSLTGMYKTDKLVWKSKKDNPTYVYLYSQKDAFKVYRPLDPFGDKFRGQNNGKILEGFEQLPDEWEHLIITKSTKDIMTLRRLGIVSCSPTSENSFRTLLSHKDELEERFGRILTFFDNDSPGIKAAKFLKESAGWDYTYLPQELAKDPSDLVTLDRSYKRLSEFLGQYNFKTNKI